MLGYYKKQCKREFWKMEAVMRKKKHKNKQVHYRALVDRTWIIPGKEKENSELYWGMITYDILKAFFGNVDAVGRRFAFWNEKKKRELPVAFI